MITVTVRTADAVGPPIEIATVPFVIGRDADVDLVLDDARVSRRHAQLEVQPDESVVLRDLDSSNGTFTGDERVEGAIWLDLPAEIRVGRTTIRIEAPAGQATVAMDLGASPPAGATVAADRPAGPPPGPSHPAAAAPPPSAPAVAAVLPTADGAAAAVAPGGWPALAGGRPPKRGRSVRPAPVAGGPRPIESTRASQLLLVLGVLGVIGSAAALFIAANPPDEIDPSLAADFRTTGFLNVGLAAAAFVLAWAVRRPLRLAWLGAFTLLAIGTALAAFDLLAASGAGFSGFILVRLGLNAMALAYLVRARGWYRPTA